MKCKCGKTMTVDTSAFPSGNKRYIYTCSFCKSTRITTVSDKDRKRGGDVQRGAGQKVLKEY